MEITLTHILIVLGIGALIFLIAILMKKGYVTSGAFSAIGMIITAFLIYITSAKIGKQEKEIRKNIDENKNKINEIEKENVKLEKDKKELLEKIEKDKIEFDNKKNELDEKFEKEHIKLDEKFNQKLHDIKNSSEQEINKINKEADKKIENNEKADEEAEFLAKIGKGEL